MELFDAFKIIETKKRGLIKILFLTLSGLTVVFFSSFLVFNGVVIEKAEEIAEVNEVLIEKNGDLESENTSLKKLIDEGLKTRIDELEKELERVTQELVEKDAALTLCNNEKDDLQSELDQCRGDLEKEQERSQNLDEALKKCNGDLSTRTSELASCKDELKTKIRELSTCNEALTKAKNDLVECRESLKGKQEDLNQCQANLTKERTAKEKCLTEKRDLQSKLNTCESNLARKDRDCAAKLKDLRKELEADCAAKLRNLRRELEAECLRRIAANTSNCDNYIGEIESLKSRLISCQQQLSNCKESEGSREYCGLEIITGYSTIRPQDYIKNVNTYLEKYAGQGNFTVRQIQVARYLYIKEIKVDGKTRVKFF